MTETVDRSPGPSPYNGERPAAISARRAGAAPAPKLLEIDNITQVFRPSPKRPAFTALKDVTITIPGGQFVSVVGPTGCGKSTLLSAVSGLVPPHAGQVRLGGQTVTDVRPEVGFIFQQDALLPWRTALQNVALALRFRGTRRKDARDRARLWLARVGLGAFENSYPHQLSGGMRKRVAIAATLVYEPSILLMDEPFSALDVQTRNLMENDLLKLWQEIGHQTVLFVTHDLEEAIGMSDRVLVLTAGPGQLCGDYLVDLPRPRSLLEVKFDETFRELYQTIWADLEGEVLKASKRDPLPTSSK
ncbi:MAG TPA: ABC transporter ATP-binding protein [Jatrophihabitantaceae bacterium]|jgi:NitT/TauT family transport system ATP-binding protein|nr:ABC transporter ATP-binding protein [Jatrophihabitantaceae bacterium]